MDNPDFLARSCLFAFLAKILDFMTFFSISCVSSIPCQDFGFHEFLAKILAIILAKKSKKNHDMGKKSKIIPVEIRAETHSCVYNSKICQKYFSN